VSTTTIKTYGSGDVHILAIDCGMKYNIIRSLVSAVYEYTCVCVCVCVYVCMSIYIYIYIYIYI
jgi:carbamoylphosphate synthase small subunit